MAYVTGTANSFSDLLTALQSACTANGWVLTGNALSRGTCYAEVTFVNQTYPCLRVRCGTGQSGGVLSGASDVQSAQLGLVAAGGDATIPAGNVPFAFPLTYCIHVLTSPDEVYCVVNYSASFYQIVAFGQSSMSGLTGTGNWYAGTDVASNRFCSNTDIRTVGGYMQSYHINGGLFMGLSGYPASQNGAVDHELDSATWAVEGAWVDWASLFWRQPNQFDQESILMPVRVYASRPAGYISPVLECAHARFVNIANLQDQQIITLGSDKWKVYPWWARGTAYNSNGYYGTYTGVMGHAIRYDGP